jgi:hypothetical protein
LRLRRLHLAALSAALAAIALTMACQKDAVEFGIIRTTEGFPIAIIQLSQQLRIGEDQEVIVVTEPEARCFTELDYEVPGQEPVRIPSKLSGLNGQVDIDWQIRIGTQPQTVNIGVTCTKEGRAGATFTTFEVVP